MSGTSSLQSIIVSLTAVLLWLLPQPHAYETLMQDLQTSFQ